MRNKFLAVICCLLSFCTMARAASDDLNYATWINPSDVFYVTTIENALLYRLDRTSAANYFAGVYNGQRLDVARKTINLNSCKNRRFRKPTVVQVVGFHNRGAQLYYDTYVVIHEDDLYYLPAAYVFDKQRIELINKGLDDKLSALNQTKDSLSIEITKVKTEVETYSKLCAEKIAYYSKMQDSLPKLISAAEQQAESELRSANELNNVTAYANWYNKLPQSTKNALKILEIRSAGLSSPNSVGGCDYSLYYTNKSKKTIKYLTWEGAIYNAVNDVVFCEIRRRSFVSGKDTGPVEYNAEYSGGTWENIIYNHSAHRLELSSISIIYMNNSRATINKADIKRMLAEPKSKSVDYSQLRLVKQNASAQYRKDLSVAKDSVAYWKKRSELLRKTVNLTYVKNSSREIASMPDCSTLMNKIQQLEKKSKNQEEVIETFKKNNFLNSTYNAQAATVARKNQAQAKQDSKLDKKIAVGVGGDLLVSSNYVGVTLPLEVVFGNISQRFNFSVAGGYTSLITSSDVTVSQFNTIATLYYNMGRSKRFCFPLSFGFSYNSNLGDEAYVVTGKYYDDDYDKVTLSAPLVANQHNVSSIISIGMRSVHWLLSLYVRFDVSPMFDKSHFEQLVPNNEYIFYDDFDMQYLVESSDSAPMLGMALRYYF